MRLINIKSIFLYLFIASFCASSNADPVWIDVRSAAEHMIDSIEGDTRISHDQIVDVTKKLHPDLDTEINLYCRSGGRASKAKTALLAAGYTNINNTGSINDARQIRGITE
ncbi:Thiosulfate sulfurtransferase PspE [Zhongshania aliphaticivorans]|uniref:Thiosulfate sulfurtransferase PspE n=1 Tax=Zhongshania aliphaticivorans TaxID=1470434 RepID=A0A5S9QK15_9GAMM|nr:rhodanese-like domain-containing protein [Zhongshania aliphaticivorans]CAA0110425.1 Thiosulfate sulfurtransferase PspE [Zhongshania aliphaticivorans]CAA0118137.1 Thiosulfate sulfurtransferase PspE [Zhongshania aliphaticivorans]CAA0122108.1 Thiosulfate sulfurtransferase PspE [Zhongshania aliphaticivorans]